MVDPILEYRYVNLAGASLDGFKKLRENVYNFRCPICGDSVQKNSKKRGYFLKKEGRFFFYCHNCGASMSLKNFLYQTDNTLFQQFQTYLIDESLYYAQYTRNSSSRGCSLWWPLIYVII